MENLDNWIEQQANAMVDLQAELTSRPALGPENDGDGEWAKARFLEEYLGQTGFAQIEHYDCPDDRVPEGSRPNFVARVPGRADGPAVWVLTHLDVVPPGERSRSGGWQGWDSDPWQVRRQGDVIYGRGVSDNQQSLVSSVFAARAVLEVGLTPPGPVNLLFVSDEETGSGMGLQHVLREHGDLFSPDDLILVPDGGSEDSTMIEVAEKSIIWLEFRVHGKQCHASRPHQGRNAFRAASRMVNKLDVGLHARFDAPDELFAPPASTFEPTLHKANVPNVNTIPGEDVFCFDCRVLPQYRLADVLKWAEGRAEQVDEQFGTETEVGIRNSFQAAPGTDPDAPVVKALDRAIREVYEVEPRTMGVGGQTVACFFRQQGLPAAVWMTSNGSAHQANEHCKVPHMIGDTRVFARIFAASV